MTIELVPLYTVFNLGSQDKGPFGPMHFKFKGLYENMRALFKGTLADGRRIVYKLGKYDHS